jgi:hypothetical protein
MPGKQTPAQRFLARFNQWMSGATPAVKAEGEKAVDAWLKRHGQTRLDIPSILKQAVADNAAAQPPPPPSDPRDTQPHPFEDPRLSPADVVHDIVRSYVIMGRHELVASTLWALHAHIYTDFEISPRLAAVSEFPRSGKSTLRKVLRLLVQRPNEETLGSGSAIYEFLDEGPGTVMLDEFDNVEPDARPLLRQIYNMGFEKGAKIGRKIAGKRKVYKIYAPMMVCGIEGFLIPTSLERTIVIDMQKAKTKPARRFDSRDVVDLNNAYSYVHHFFKHTKLACDPELPPGLGFDRLADNWRPLIAVADACGPAWGKLARETALEFVRREKAAQPYVRIIRHGLLIFSIPDVAIIKSVDFNKALLRLDIPDARWHSYRGANGGQRAHPITLNEQAMLLEQSGIRSHTIWPNGRGPGKKSIRGYTLAEFEAAGRKWDVEAPATEAPDLKRLLLASNMVTDDE